MNSLFRILKASLSSQIRSAPGFGSSVQGITVNVPVFRNSSAPVFQGRQEGYRQPIGVTHLAEKIGAIQGRSPSFTHYNGSYGFTPVGFNLDSGAERDSQGRSVSFQRPIGVSLNNLSGIRTSRGSQAFLGRSISSGSYPAPIGVSVDLSAQVSQLQGRSASFESYPAPIGVSVDLTAQTSQLQGRSVVSESYPAPIGVSFGDPIAPESFGVTPASQQASFGRSSSGSYPAPIGVSADLTAQTSQLQGRSASFESYPAPIGVSVGEPSGVSA